MLKVCERFPQIGTITDYMALPPGERALYDWYTLEAIRAEAGAPVLRIEMPKGGRRLVLAPHVLLLDFVPFELGGR